MGSLGILLGLFGVFRLVTEIPAADLAVLGLWLVGAVVIHDGLLSPLIVGVGATITRFVPPRSRRYLQGGLVAGAMITVIAIPLIYRAGTVPKVKAALRQDFGANLTGLLATVAAVSLTLYAAHVARDRRLRVSSGTASDQRPSEAKVRPVDDQTSETE